MILIQNNDITKNNNVHPFNNNNKNRPNKGNNNNHNGDEKYGKNAQNKNNNRLSSSDKCIFIYKQYDQENVMESFSNTVHFSHQKR